MTLAIPTKTKRLQFITCHSPPENRSERIIISQTQHKSAVFDSAPATYFPPPKQSISVSTLAFLKSHTHTPPFPHFSTTFFSPIHHIVRPSVCNIGLVSLAQTSENIGSISPSLFNLSPGHQLEVRFLYQAVHGTGPI